MVEAWLVFLGGALLGVSLAAPPGPVLALMAREVGARGPWASMKVGLGATTADMVFAVLAVAGAVAVVAERPLLLAVLSVVGAALLAYYAWGAVHAGRAARAGALAEDGGSPATYTMGFLAAATSPFNLAWWIGPGTALLANEGPLLAAGMFVGILGFLSFFVTLVDRLGRRVRRFQEGAAYVSAVILAVFALLVAWRAAGLLLA
jgi:threonine/homoserine/homoserine lactone efflux protein